MVDKTQLSSTSQVTKPLGIAGKTVSTVTTFRHGCVDVVDIYCTDTVHYYVKMCQGKVEIGGTCEMGTGTCVGGR